MTGRRRKYLLVAEASLRKPPSDLVALGWVSRVLGVCRGGVFGVEALQGASCVPEVAWHRDPRRTARRSENLEQDTMNTFQLDEHYIISKHLEANSEGS